jgi:hypothetical protein
MEKRTNQPNQFAVHTVVLYEPGSGHIVHTHHKFALLDTPAPDKKELEAKAFEMAAHNRVKTAGLSVLHSDTAKPGALYRVDPQKRVLIEAPLDLQGKA